MRMVGIITCTYLCILLLLHIEGHIRGLILFPRLKFCISSSFLVAILVLVAINLTPAHYLYLSYPPRGLLFSLSGSFDHH